MSPQSPHIDKLERNTTYQGYPDPFAPKPRRFGAEFLHTILATALFRCSHYIVFFAGWATFVTVYNHQHKAHPLVIQPTLLTVVGTVLGFVVSYRTTSSFERYNEGRRYWSQIVLASRSFARTAWFHIPETMPVPPGDTSTPEQIRAQVLIEKKTAINLLEAFAVAVKHYLRGEDSIYYEDLYHLVKFLPAYALPQGIPSKTDLSNVEPDTSDAQQARLSDVDGHSSSAQHLPMPVSTAPEAKKSSTGQHPTSPRSPYGREKFTGDEKELLPSRMPPKFSLFDIFPFSLLVKVLTRRGNEVTGRTAAKLRARSRDNVSHNIPLEISLYLSSYVAAVQFRKVIDPPTATNLLATITLLVDALTGLERILTTPIPFSYSFHLWVTTLMYCLALPFQIWPTMKWHTIPATMILAFIFFGFLVAGEEIENPFGYDKNDLNMDHYCRNLIRQELHAITATPAPEPSHWAFSPDNDFVFAKRVDEKDRVRPMDWVNRGPSQIRAALAQ